MKKIYAVQFVITILMCMTIGLVYAATAADTGNSRIVTASLVNQDPDPADAGDIVEVRVGIENKGGDDVNNLMVAFTSGYPFLEIPGENYIFNVGTIRAYQYSDNMQIVKFKVRIDKEATSGDYDFRIKQYIQGKESSSITSSVTVSVGSRESAEVIYIDKTVLIPGKQVPLKFTINNVGSAPLRDITFSWVNEDKVLLPVGGDNTKYIKYIDVGDSAVLEYQVIANTNTDAGLYQLALTLAYSDTKTAAEKVINTIAGVYVGGGTDFDVAFSESTGTQTSFTVANIGSNPASSVSVIIPSQDGWKTSGTNSMIIGNLNTGDYTVASFSLQPSQIAQGSGIVQGIPQRQNQQLNASSQRIQQKNTLKIQIAYTDTMGNRETVEKEVTVNPQPLSATLTGQTGTTANFRGMRQQQSFYSKYKNYIWLIVVLIVVVTGAIGHQRYRKEKLLNPSIKFKDFLMRRKKKK